MALDIQKLKAKFGNGWSSTDYYFTGGGIIKQRLFVFYGWNLGRLANLPTGCFLHKLVGWR